MGVGLSSFRSTQNAQISHAWLCEFADSTVKYASRPSLESFSSGETQYLALSYQASESPLPCNPQQHLRFSLSKDGECAAAALSPSQVCHNQLQHLPPVHCRR